VARGPGGGWILTGDPVGTPDGHAFRAVLPRRPVLERAG
jgi:hypothetical protein